MKRLLRNKLVFFGSLLVMLFCLPAILGYLITPDNTNNSNDLMPQTGTVKPGTRIEFIRIKTKNSNPDNHNLFLTWLRGKEIEGTAIPLNQYKWQGDTLLYSEYGEQEIQKISKDRLVHHNNGHSIYSRTFWLGSDRFGRDMLSRLIIGARISLIVGLVAVIISLIIGTSVGMLAGYKGGWTDTLLSWKINVFWAIPTLLIALGLSFILGKGLPQVLIAIGLSNWVEVARVVRGQTLQIKEKEYIAAAQISGFSTWRILTRHVLPNLKSSLTVLATTNFASAILLEAGLSFLGLGIAAPAPSWGIMVYENRGNLVLDSAWLAIIPGACIMILVSAFNLFAMGIREVLEK